jgi:hypothetical protein
MATLAGSGVDKGAPRRARHAQACAIPDRVGKIAMMGVELATLVIRDPRSGAGDRFCPPYRLTNSAFSAARRAES